MAEPKVNEAMEKLVSLCKRKGLIFQSSDIYGGINGFWDYGPLGAELKRNVKELWWRSMTRMRDDVVGLEATIIMHPNIWKASGHVATFADMMRECPLTKKRVRADQVEEQTGTIFRWAGARSEKGGWTTEHPIRVILPKGEHVDTARRRAREYYAMHFQDPRRVNQTEVEILGETTEPVVDSIDFHPETWVELTEARPFNLMFKTYVGPVESEDSIAYLRPETAQAIFAQFKNVLDTSRQTVPFGIAQVGKAFRNEVTPRNFTFRSREFEQMELEFFIKPDEVVEAIAGSVAKPGEGHPGAPQANWGWQMWHKYWVEERIRFYEGIGVPRHTLVEYWQKPAELAHYARACVDILFKFPFSKRDAQGELMGEELEGIAARSDFDLSQHERASGKPMTVFDEELRVAWGKLEPAKRQELGDRYYQARYNYLTKSGVAADEAAAAAKASVEGLAKGQYIPHVIEPSAGVDRLILALLANAYAEETVTDEKGKAETRVVLRFHPRVAPVKVGIFPLLKNKPELVQKAMALRDTLRPHMAVFYDETGAIGRRYRRQDEAGTPYGVTIDFDTLGEKPELLDTVTLRERDAMTQTRIKIADLLPFLLSKIG